MNDGGEASGGSSAAARRSGTWWALGSRRPRLKVALIVCLALGASAPPGARAELLEVTQVASGMECFECARRLRLDVQKLDGVIDAFTSWNRRILRVRFRPGNRATLSALRTIVRQHHFVPGEAEIVASGRLGPAEDGRTTLQVSGSTESFVLAGSIAPVPGFSRGATADLRLRGRVDGDPTGPPSAGRQTLWVLELGALPAVPAAAPDGAGKER